VRFVGVASRHCNFLVWLPVFIGSQRHGIKPGCSRFVLSVMASADYHGGVQSGNRTEVLELRFWEKGRVRMPSWEPVYRVVKQIPRGRVLPYGALAKILRLPGGARSAGRAMAATPSGKGIPWHRVVGAGGKLLIREPYASLQKKLLESEGIEVIESRVNLKRHLWSPVKTNKKGVKEKAARKRTGK
jgi:methylated-DNA-protein-cysteine methyltransferase related protein